MADGQHKSKIISFRIADDEYSKVELLARNNGFTSVSYFAREATLSSGPREILKTPLDLEMNRLRGQVETLTLCIDNMINRLGGALNTDPVTDCVAARELTGGGESHLKPTTDRVTR